MAPHPPDLAEPKFADRRAVPDAGVPGPVARVVRWTITVVLWVVTVTGILAVPYGFACWFASKSSSGTWKELGMALALVIAVVGFLVAIGAGLLSWLAMPRRHRDRPVAAEPTAARYVSVRVVQAASVVTSAMVVVSAIGVIVSVHAANTSPAPNADGYLWFVIGFMAAVLSLLLLGVGRAIRPAPR